MERKTDMSGVNRFLYLSSLGLQDLAKNYISATLSRVELTGQREVERKSEGQIQRERAREADRQRCERESRGRERETDSYAGGLSWPSLARCSSFRCSLSVQSVLCFDGAPLLTMSCRQVLLG